MKKGNEKRRKITLKKGGKCLKNASFWAINTKYFKGGGGKKLSKSTIYILAFP